MKIASHYIFLPKEKIKEKVLNKPDKDGVIELKIRAGVYSYISQVFTVSPMDCDEPLFKQKYSTNIDFSGLLFDVVFSQYNVGENAFLSIIVEGKTKLQAIKCLEYIQLSIMNSGIKDEYIVVISCDAISEYYCNKIYPKLNSIERKLRRLLLNIYIVNFDKEYYEITISKEIQDKAKGKIRAGRNPKTKKEKYIKEFFYSLDFGDINEILFTPTWQDFEESSKQDFLNKHSDLSQLSDEELRNRFIDFSPKSDWERFFENKTDETAECIETLIDQIRKFRNSVAHCKSFESKDYNECQDLICKLNRNIDQAIKVTEEKDFLEKNAKIIIESFGNIIEKLTVFSSAFAQKTASLLRSGVFSIGLKSVGERFGKLIDAAFRFSSIRGDRSVDDLVDESEDNAEENEGEIQDEQKDSENKQESDIDK